MRRLKRCRYRCAAITLSASVAFSITTSTRSCWSAALHGRPLEAAKSSSRLKFTWLVARRRSTTINRSRLTTLRWMRVDDGCGSTCRIWTSIAGYELRRASSQALRTLLPSSTVTPRVRSPTTRQSVAALRRSLTSNVLCSKSNGR